MIELNDAIALPRTQWQALNTILNIPVSRFLAFSTPDSLFLASLCLKCNRKLRL